jgi:alpha-galactosidase
MRTTLRHTILAALAALLVATALAQTSESSDCTTCPGGVESTSNAATSATATAPGALAVYLSDLDLSHMRQGFGKPQRDKSVTEKPLTIAGAHFDRGLGTHAASTMWIDLFGTAQRFHSIVGVDDAANGPGMVKFIVYGDGRKLWQSRVLQKGTSQTVNLSLSGVQKLLLKVEPGDKGITFDHADWADARITYVAGAKLPVAVAAPRDETQEILTPRVSPGPRINGPKVYGCRADNPFLYRIPATGERPMHFSAEGVPSGIQLDANTGILSGTAPARGEYNVTLKASNSIGQNARTLRIISGENLALTPYMGWNHWYAHYDKVTDALVRRAADAMINSGMADAGYNFVCIDDCWMNSPKNKDPKRVGPLRDAQGIIQPNSYFPDMRALTDYIHSRGLKTGIYSSPGPLTCGKFGASYQHEAQDAATFAGWGFDLLKYDWCSYGKIAPNPTLEQMQAPYQLMGDLLLKQKRDIIYNLCQYGMGNVWEWGAQVHAHSWRTSGDLGYELDRIFQVARTNAEHRAWNGPSTWNDPDYLQIGMIGDLHARGELKRGVLTPTEEYAFMSLWCLSAAPLVYSGDMDHLDAFTTNVLCNNEVIEIDQDPLGQCATVSPLTEDAYIMVKEMEDGSKAVGLCNGGEFDATLTARWNVLGLRGKQRIRDVWRQKDLGSFEQEFTASVRRHSVVLLRFFPS